MKRLLRSLLPGPVKDALSRGRERVLLASLRAAVREQGLSALAARLREIIPDVSRQYSSFAVDTPYLEEKVRGQQAFQISLALGEIDSLPGASVVDIGDSSGAHVLYLKALSPASQRRWLSVNLDAAAVERIRARGLEAMLVRAEELHAHDVRADIFLSFETLEHLSDPISFLHALAQTRCRRLVLTVPYVRRSRVGLHHIRQGLRKRVSPESTHHFELSPEDWRLVFLHAGWRVVRDEVYLQYPRRHPLAATKAVWGSMDFEGFYGAVLTPDPSWSVLYSGWQDEKATP
ncbi:hypothetical protein EPO15_08770 [bacterium]|nr:MAG: hypothetical protein EPO15_08770 [bacterium]